MPSLGTRKEQHILRNSGGRAGEKVHVSDSEALDSLLEQATKQNDKSSSVRGEVQMLRIQIHLLRFSNWREQLLGLVRAFDAQENCTFLLQLLSVDWP